LIQSLFAEKFKLAIASSSHLETIEKVISKLDLSEFFQARISGTELKHSKPDPEIFIKAAEIVHSRPVECLVIEDSENGVKAAKAALMMCIGYQNPNSGAQDLHQADIIINTFEEINAEKIRNLR
jgi:beta-phosphoglucomutase-like phosphatase (HAD superfamily)